MNDRTRRVASTGSDFERALLRSARLDAPPAGQKGRALAVLGSLGAGTAIATGAKAAAATAGATQGLATGGSLLALKWLAVVGVVAAGATGVAYRQAKRAPSEMDPVRPPTAAIASPPRLPVAPAAIAVPLHAPVPSASALVVQPSVTPARVPAPPRAPAESLDEEVAALDDVRSALAAGEAPRALASLDRYQAAFPHAILAPEATLLRIDALVRAGDRDGARRTADQFVASHPNSPYAARIASLLAPAPNP